MFLYGLTIAFLWPAGEHSMALLAIALSPILVWISINDIRSLEIPDRAITALIAVATAFLLITAPQAIWSHFLSGVLVAGFLWMVGELYYRKTGHEGLGIGDAKLFGAGVLQLGPWKLPELFLMSSLGGIIACLVIMITSGSSRAKGVPFGPFIAYAILILSLLDPLFF